MARSFTDELTIDPETGLPALPDGLAWRVRSIGSSTLTVELVVRREHQTFWKKLFGVEPRVTWEDVTWEETKGADSYTYIYSDEPTKQDVLDAATKIYGFVYSRHQSNQVMEDLVGLYPPKSVL